MRYVFIVFGWIWTGAFVLALIGILLAHPWGPMMRVDTEAARATAMQANLFSTVGISLVMMVPGLIIAGIGHMIGRRA